MPRLHAGEVRLSSACQEDGRAWVTPADELWRKGAETSFAVTEAATGRLADADRPPRTPPSMTAVDQGTARRMTQFPVPLLRTNVKPARSRRVRVPL